MAVRFSVLASGSGGNASLLQVNGFGLLIDAGLGPRLLAGRLAEVGAAWRDVNAVVLTHTHSDHWKDTTLAHLRKLGIPLYCHPGHHPVLGRYGSAFDALRAARLVHTYEEGQVLELPAGVTCRPLRVKHDSHPTFGFRLEGSPGLFGPAWSLGYLADLGVAPAELVEAMAGVDLLALEFNHDEAMERRSSRPRHLIARVLGDHGHLSNRQAAEVFAAVLRSSGETLRHLIQLHLSRDCNLPALAREAARQTLGGNEDGVTVHTAEQDAPTPFVSLNRPSARRAAARRPSQPRLADERPVQRALPGFDDEALSEAG